MSASTPPVVGLMWQPSEGGLPGRWIFACGCGAEMPYATDLKLGGIDEVSAEQLGWRRIDGQWECPVCTGNRRP